MSALEGLSSHDDAIQKTEKMAFNLVQWICSSTTEMVTVKLSN